MNTITYTEILTRRKEIHGPLAFFGHPFERSTLFFKEEIKNRGNAYVIDVIGMVTKEGYQPFSNLRGEDRKKFFEAFPDGYSVATILGNRIFYDVERNIVLLDLGNVEPHMKMLHVAQGLTGLKEMNIYVLGLATLQKELINLITILMEAENEVSCSIASAVDLTAEEKSSIKIAFGEIILAGRTNIEVFLSSKDGTESIVYLNNDQTFSVKLNNARDYPEIRIYVLDTEVLLENPEILALRNRKFIIPAIVVEELNVLEEKMNPILKRKAENAGRILKLMLFTEPNRVKIGFANWDNMPREYNEKSNIENAKLATAKGVKNSVFVTTDTFLGIKANSMRIACINNI